MESRECLARSEHYTICACYHHLLLFTRLLSPCLPLPTLQHILLSALSAHPPLISRPRPPGSGAQDGVVTGPPHLDVWSGCAAEQRRAI